MIDVIGAISLTALAVTSPVAVILASSLERAQAVRVAALAAAWLAAVVGLGAADVFARLGVPVVGLAVLGPVVLGALSVRRVSWLRVLAFETPVAVLIAIHVGRLLGGFFLALHAHGRLPATFARTAGWGDIAVAVLALPIAWMAARRASHWRAAALLWNAAAFIDLLTAVTLGIGSAQDGPLAVHRRGRGARHDQRAALDPHSRVSSCRSICSRTSPCSRSSCASAGRSHPV